MMYRFVPLALIASLAVSPATAAVENVGIDVGTDGSLTQVNFFDASGSGQELGGAFGFFFIPIAPGETISFSIDTASEFGGLSLVAAELFVDAFDVDGFNSSTVSVQGVDVGSLANTPEPSEIPIEDGPVGARTINSEFDVDNTFFDLGAFLTDLTTDSTFEIEITNDTTAFFGPGEEVRIDGINIQVEFVDLDPSDDDGDLIPEPLSVGVWLGLAGSLVGAGRRRR